MSNLVIVLVPGGMGSKLSLSGTVVWDFNLSLWPPDAHFEGVHMIVDPGLLLPWLTLEPIGLLGVYDDLLSFLEDNGYQSGATKKRRPNLFLFPYDFRLGMETNATLLADFVKKEIAPNIGGKQILFIAHSSGCMVVRWALTVPSADGKPLIDSARVKAVVAAGPPMLGMASPLRDIMEMPRLDDSFDALFSIVQKTYPSLADLVAQPLTKCLMTVTGQLEGLPPDTVPILQGGSQQQDNLPYPALNWGGWPNSLSTLIATVRSTKKTLADANWSGTGCTVVASKSHPTDTGYVIDTNDRFKSAWKTGDGDGSVLVESALAYCPGGDSLIVDERHRKLLDDPKTRTFLKAVI